MTNSFRVSFTIPAKKLTLIVDLLKNDVDDLAVPVGYLWICRVVKRCRIHLIAYAHPELVQSGAERDDLCRDTRRLVGKNEPPDGAAVCSQAWSRWLAVATPV